MSLAHFSQSDVKRCVTMCVLSVHIGTQAYKEVDDFMRLAEAGPMKRSAHVCVFGVDVFSYVLELLFEQHK